MHHERTWFMRTWTFYLIKILKLLFWVFFVVERSKKQYTQCFASNTVRAWNTVTFDCHHYRCHCHSHSHSQCSRTIESITNAIICSISIVTPCAAIIIIICFVCLTAFLSIPYPTARQYVPQWKRIGYYLIFYYLTSFSFSAHFFFFLFFEKGLRKKQYSSFVMRSLIVFMCEFFSLHLLILWACFIFFFLSL